MTHQFKIAVLMPTRGRTEALNTAVTALIERASQPKTLQLLFGFDHDDRIGIDYYKRIVQPYLISRGITHSARLFQPMTYTGLNIYYNTLAEHTDSDWLMLYSDDAIMETQGWDDIITAHDGEFILQKVHTHMGHPYSIFPIYPREWYDLFNFCSVQQMVDAELSQIAYPLDLVRIVDIEVTHDRYDLTGNNLDETETSRVRLEGNPSDPRDFAHPTQIQHRERCMRKIAAHLESKGHDLSFWNNVLAGKQNPYEKMQANDLRGQTTRGQ